MTRNASQKASVNFLFCFGLILKIQMKIRKSQSGLGVGGAVALSPDDAALLAPSRSSSNWQKARERYADTCQPAAAASASSPAPKERLPQAWLKAEDTGNAADTQADRNDDVNNQTQGSG